jgi:hypothetical protein
MNKPVHHVTLAICPKTEINRYELISMLLLFPRFQSIAFFLARFGSQSVARAAGCNRKLNSV